MSNPRDTSNPIAAAQEKARQELPRRFYAEATIARQDDGFALLLDGRTARTPARQPLLVPREDVAQALAAEWSAQEERIDPATMPVTRIVNSAIDGVARQMEAVRADIVRHAASDLLCYRAGGPQGLVARQEREWSPLVAWARETLGARLMLAEGIVFVAQDAEALAAIERALADYDALALAAIHTVTTLTGSTVIALAIARHHLTLEAAWSAAHVDEDWQMSQWGRDEIALRRRESRWREMLAAGVILGA